VRRVFRRRLDRTVQPSCVLEPRVVLKPCIVLSKSDNYY
jgi:hypothetical protein